jgi:hypothetical protein
MILKSISGLHDFSIDCFSLFIYIPSKNLTVRHVKIYQRLSRVPYTLSLKASK